MAEKQSKTTFKFTAFSGYLLSLVLLVVSYIIYAYLPINDDFTNSPDVAGSEAVGVFLLSPLAAVFSLVAFVVFAVVNRKYYFSLISADNKIGSIKLKGAFIEWMIVLVSLVIVALLSVCCAFAFILYNEYKELGFVAPVGDTVYFGYQQYIFGATIAHSVFFVLTVLRMLKVNWLNSLICAIKALISKIKKSASK